MGILRSFSLALSLLFLFTACTDKSPLKIGYVATVTGRHSDSGVKARNGAQLAVDVINERGGVSGRKIELVVKDNQNDPKINEKVFSELADEGVVAVIGPLRSSMAASALSATKGRDVLIVSPTVSTDSIKDRDDNFIRVIKAASGQAVSLAEKVIHDGRKTASVVFDSSNRPYTEPLFKVFREEFEGRGGTVGYVSGMEGASHEKFAEIAGKIAEAGDEALVLISSGIDAAFLCQQLYKIGTKTNIYGSYWVKSGDIVEEGGKSVEGITIVTSYERESDSEEFKDFKYLYLDVYKSEPQYLSIYAYDATMLLYEALTNADSISCENIKREIIRKGSYKGLKDDFDINKFGDATRRDMFVRVQDGSFVRVGN